MRAYLNAVLVLLLLFLPTLTMAEFTINGVYGPRYLDDPLWEPIDGDEAFGLDVTWGRDSWPVRLAFGFSDAGDSNLDECNTGFFWGDYCPPENIGSILERSIFDISVGITRYWFPLERMEIYVGAGASFVEISAENSPDGFVDEDESGALYAQSGLLWVIPLKESRYFLHLGVDVRFLTGTSLDVFGVDVDADSYQIGFVFGGGARPRTSP